MDSVQPALQLILFNLPIGEEQEYAEKLRNTFEKGLIIGHKPYYQRTVILFVQGIQEAILIMQSLIKPQSNFKGIFATLKPQEIIRLENYKNFILSKKRTHKKENLSEFDMTEKIIPTELEYKLSEITKSTSGEFKENNNSLIKVFIGCLPKTATDDLVKKVFERYGEVVEAHVLRDNNGQTKYSAFVYYSEMCMALDAIRNLDKQYTMPEGNRPIEVRLAEKRCFRVPKTKDIINHQRIQTIEKNENNQSDISTTCNYPISSENLNIHQTSSMYKGPNSSDNYSNTIQELLHMLKLVSFKRIPHPYYE